MISKIVEKAAVIPTLTDYDERELLAKLATEVPHKGTILEIGALYGGVTAILALSAPTAQVYAIDNFSWHPEGYPPTSEELLIENMKKLDIYNVEVIAATSKQASRLWGHRKIDLLWIDGGHDFKTVYFDLFHYSRFSNVVALHDYDNPAWSDIRQAIEIFISGNPKWQLTQLVGMVAVLRKR